MSSSLFSSRLAQLCFAMYCLHPQIIASWKCPKLIISYQVGNISWKSIFPPMLDTTPKRNGLLSLQEASSEAQFYTKDDRLMLNLNEIR